MNIAKLTNPYFLLLLLLKSTGFIYGQNVDIKGIAPAHHGKEIILYAYTDLITYSLYKEAVDTVKNNGHFELKTDVNQPQAILLKIGNLKGKLYIEPYFQYGIIFPQADSERFVNPNTEKDVDINIVGDSTELNARIIDFNMQFDAFWMKNYEAFVTRHIHSKLDSFQLACNKRYEKVKSTYFKNYIRYSFAIMNENTGRHHNYLGKEYLINHPILYHHFEYMQFFNQYFKLYLQTKSVSKLGAQIIDIINEDGNYEALNSILKDDPLLKSDSLRELVILKCMYESYYLPKYKREKITTIIQQLLQQSKIDEHKKIAQHILNNFRQLQAGSEAPDFTLKDAKGTEHSLSDYKGKFVYLEFFASWNTASLAEMKKLEQIKNKYHDNVVFISISIDDSLSTFKNFVKENSKYNWVLLHAGKSNAMEAYGIKSVPAYFFIDRMGNLVHSPALKPSEGIEFKFKQLFNRPNGRKN